MLLNLKGRGHSSGAPAFECKAIAVTIEARMETTIELMTQPGNPIQTSVLSAGQYQGIPKQSKIKYIKRRPIRKLKTGLNGLS